MREIKSNFEIEKLDIRNEKCETDLMSEEAVGADNGMAEVRATMQAPEQDNGIGSSWHHMLHVRPELQCMDAAPMAAIAG